MEKYLPFRPPFYANIEENYKANLVYTLAWAWIIGVTIIAVIMVVLLPAFWYRGIITVASVNSSAFICLFLNRRGRLRFASFFFPVALWLTATLLALTSGGISAPAAVAYLPVIITSGFLMGGRAGVIMAASCILSSLSFVVLENNGGLPARQIVHTPFSVWMVYSISGLMIAIMQYLANSHLSSSIKTIARETLERKQAEMRLKESEFNNRMVVQNKILGVAWSSPEGQLINASDTFCEMLGYSTQELRGTYIKDFTHPDDLLREIQLVQRVSENEPDLNSYTIEKRYKHKSGEYFWAELCLTAYRNSVTNAVDFYIGIVQNIQVRKLGEEALKESEERYRMLNESLEKKVLERTRELQAVNSDLYRFSVMLSHDLRGAIRRIKSFGNLASKALPASEDREAADYLEVVKRNADKMDGIVTGLLEMSKLGNKPLQLKRVNVEETVHALIADLEKEWQNKICKLDITPLPTIYSDPILIQQIFANLLSNAFKYSSKNQVIQINIACTDKGDHHLFSIKDNGIGFNMADSSNLFKEFVRLHGDHEFEGVGIGLTSVKRFVEKLGGRIWAESQPTKGSTFHFTIPAQTLEVV